MCHYLENYVDQNKIDELIYTLAHRRKHLDARGFMLIRSGGQGVRSDSEQRSLVTSVDLSGNRLPVSFVFTGQGAQYAGMAKELLFQSPVFIETIRRLDGHLQALPGNKAPKWTLEQTILDAPDVSQINHVTRSQPVCTAIQVSLVEVLRTWGVQPISTVGHSSGEIAAAYAAGFLTERQAILVAYFRGYSTGQLRSNGCMMVAALTVEAATELILQQDLKSEVCVACVNSPESITLSGPNEAIDVLYRYLQHQKTFSRKIETGGRAYHSFMMKEISPLYESLLAPYMEKAAVGIGHESMTFHTTMYSSVGTSGEKLRVFNNSLELTTTGYWCENLETSVQFSSAVVNLVAAAGSKTHLIEIGPHAALKGPIDQIRTKLNLSREQLPYNSTLRRNEDADRCMKILAGNLFNLGNAIKFLPVNNSTSDIQSLKPVHDLPSYPWDYTAGLLWAEPRASIEFRERKYLRHELLGSSQLASDGIAHRWRNILQLDEVPWIHDHKLESQTVFPAAGYLSMAMEALSQARGLQPGVGLQNVVYEFRDVNIMTAFVVTEERETGVTCRTELHTTLTQQKLSTATMSADWYDFSISSWSSGKTAQHCVGSIRMDFPKVPAMVMKSGPAIVADNYENWEMTKWYAKLDEEGLCFGPAFQTLSSMQTDINRMRPEGISTTRLVQQCCRSEDDRYSGTYYTVHPLTIDACVQAAIMAGTGGNLTTLRAHLPVFIAKCRIRMPDPETVGCEASIHSKSKTTGPATKQIDSSLYDQVGRAVVNMEEVRLSLYSGKATILNSASTTERHPCLRVDWKPDVSRLFASSGESLSRYIEEVITTLKFNGKNFDPVVAVLLDLVGHKNPRMRVLELGGEEGHAESYLELLDKGTAFPRYRSWSRGKFDQNGKLSTDDGTNGPFDVIVVSEVRPLLL